MGELLVLAVTTVLLAVFLATVPPKWSLLLLVSIFFVFSYTPIEVLLDTRAVAQSEYGLLGLENIPRMVGLAALLAGVIRFRRQRRWPSVAVLAAVLLVASTGLVAVLQQNMSGLGSQLSLVGYLLFGASLAPILRLSHFTPAARLTTSVSLLIILFAVIRRQTYVRFLVEEQQFSVFDLRPLTATGAIVIGLVLVFQVLGYRPFRSSWLSTGSVAVNTVALVLLQQRSVWLATAVGVVIAMMTRLRFQRRSGVQPLGMDSRPASVLVLILSLGFAIALIVLLPALNKLQAPSGLPAGTELSSPSPSQGTVLSIREVDLQTGSRSFDVLDGNSFDTAFTDASNLRFRWRQWGQFVDTLTLNPEVVLIGRFAGNFSSVSWSPHSQWLDVGRQFGLIGIVGFAALLAWPLLGHPPSGWSRLARFPAVCTTVAFSLLYLLVPPLATLLGMVQPVGRSVAESTSDD